MNDATQFFSASAGGYEISRSLRFNAPDSSFLSRTPGSAGNRKTWTWAGWVKRSGLGTNQTLLCSVTANGQSTNFTLIFGTNDKLGIEYGTNFWLQTTQVFRDTSAWFHLQLAVDTTQATASERMKLWVNGAQVTAFDTNSPPAQNTDLAINRTELHTIGSLNTALYFSGYLADIHFIDGQALTPSSFTEVDATTGQLIPKAYTGSYGTNGFWLKFSDNSAATATTLGKDYSGNNNNWTPNNLVVASAPTYSASVYQGSSATPFESGRGPTAMFDNSEATFCGTGSQGFYWDVLSSYNLSGTLEVLMENGGGDDGVTITGGVNNGQTLYQSGGSYINCGNISGVTRLTFVASTGAASTYCKAIKVGGVLLVDGSPASVDSLVDTPTSGSQVDTGLGGQVTGNYATLNPLRKAGSHTLSNGNLDIVMGSDSGSRTTFATIGVSSGKWYWETTITTATNVYYPGVGVNTNLALSPEAQSGDTASGFMYLMNGQKFSNGTLSSYGASFSNGDVIGIALDMDAGTITFYKNGSTQGQAFSGITGTATPCVIGFGPGATPALTVNYGARPFAYPAPSGFKALCDTNLPAPVVAKSSDYFQTVLYTGNGSNRSITTTLSPDLVWIKSRSNGANHFLFDTVRGATNRLCSSLTNAEASEPTTLTAFNSDGFSLGTDAGVGACNLSGQTYVAWAFDAGSNTVSNTAGSITSSVRANASAGFSVVSYTSNSSAVQTVGHGLNVAPAMIIWKDRDAATNWFVFHNGGTPYMLEGLNTTAAGSTSYANMNSTLPTSSVFTLNSGGYTINPAGNHAMIAYCWSPVAGYSAMGSANGGNPSFVHTGFRPRFLMLKRTNSTSNWHIFDTSRSPYNASTLQLYANSSVQEEDQPLDAIDFVSNGFVMRSTNSFTGASWIYFAVAESPFQYARAR